MSRVSEASDTGNKNEHMYWKTFMLKSYENGIIDYWLPLGKR